MARKRYMEAKARKEASLEYYQRRAKEIDPEEEYKKMESQLKLFGELKNGLLELCSTVSISKGINTERMENFERPAFELKKNNTTSTSNSKYEGFGRLKDHHFQKWQQAGSASIDGNVSGINWNFSEESTSEIDSFSTIEVLEADSLWSDWSSSWGSGWVLEEEEISEFAWIDWENWADKRKAMDRYFELKLERKAEKRRMEREWFCLDWLFREKKEEEVEMSESVCDEPSDVPDYEDHYPERIKSVFSVPIHWFQPKGESLADKSLIEIGKDQEKLTGSIPNMSSTSAVQTRELSTETCGSKQNRCSEMKASELKHDTNSEVFQSNQLDKLVEANTIELSPQELREVYEENRIEYGWPDGDLSDQQIAALFLDILLREMNLLEIQSGFGDIEIEYTPNLGVSKEDLETFMGVVRRIMKNKGSFEEIEDQEVERALAEAGFCLGLAI